ncbi:MAG: YicC/YloC family endoribonuclease [Woeseiaceae bacterium]|nr:YicC/YloC family endoribonuclease [Woeseiaceae bacterium]
MLNSMTGFARQTVDLPFGTLTCELRAVNHRYFDVQFRLPEELKPREIELRKQVASTVRRGKVECSMHLRRAAGDIEEIRLNEELVQNLTARVTELKSLLPDSQSINPVDVLRWPGVVQEPDIEAEPLFNASSELLDKTLADLGKMRASEGSRIFDMLEARCGEILAIAATVSKRIPEVMQAVRQKQRERLDNLNVEADPARLEMELALIAQKLDVDEELDRLISHVSEIRKVLQKGEPVGRRLDFLMQELNREANTLGSKSADTETTKAAVDLKVLIEQMREQVQNVE